MTMKTLQFERERRGWSRLRLSQEAKVAPYVVSGAESGRRVPYFPEILRMAASLDWPGQPEELLDDARS